MCGWNLQGRIPCLVVGPASDAAVMSGSTSGQHGKCGRGWRGKAPALGPGHLGRGTWAGRLDPTAAGPDPTMPITAAACEDADRFRLASLDYAPWESR